MVITMNDKEIVNLKELLKTSIVDVVFRKLNGEKRVLKCTLYHSYLPVTDGPIKESKENDTSLAVWDLEANGWRSFRYDSVISYGFKNEE